MCVRKCSRFAECAKTHQSAGHCNFELPRIIPPSHVHTDVVCFVVTDAPFHDHIVGQRQRRSPVVQPRGQPLPWHTESVELIMRDISSLSRCRATTLSSTQSSGRFQRLKGKHSPLHHTSHAPAPEPASYALTAPAHIPWQVPAKSDQTGKGRRPPTASWRGSDQMERGRVETPSRVWGLVHPATQSDRLGR